MQIEVGLNPNCSELVVRCVVLKKKEITKKQLEDFREFCPWMSDEDETFFPKEEKGEIHIPIQSYSYHISNGGHLSKSELQRLINFLEYNLKIDKKFIKIKQATAYVPGND